MKKELSVGVIITDGYSILGCRPFGKRDQRGCYDLPKGHWESGESLIETAKREVEEETGFRIWENANLVNLGQFKYTPTKDLHLFLFAEDVLPDPLTLHCASTFDFRGTQVPEMLGYKHVPITELDWFFESLAVVIDQALQVFDKLPETR
jgi:8-oxo-dGTP pyrophosphatase MutT (NUDIX family)